MKVSTKVSLQLLTRLLESVEITGLEDARIFEAYTAALSNAAEEAGVWYSCQQEHDSNESGCGTDCDLRCYYLEGGSCTGCCE